MARYTSCDIEVHLTTPTDGMDTTGVDVIASGLKAAELLQTVVEAEFPGHTVSVMFERVIGPDTIYTPADVDKADIDLLINETVARYTDWIVDLPTPSYTSLHQAIASTSGWVSADAGADGQYVVHVRPDEEERRIPAASDDEVGEWYTVDGYLLSVTKEGMPPHFSRFFAEPGALSAIEAYLAAGEVLGQTSFTWRASDGE